MCFVLLLIILLLVFAVSFIMYCNECTYHHNYETNVQKLNETLSKLSLKLHLDFLKNNKNVMKSK